jgi:hypothetical protein
MSNKSLQRWNRDGWWETKITCRRLTQSLRSIGYIIIEPELITEICMSGIDREITLDRRHIAKHVAGTPQSNQLLSRGRSAHLFNNEATLHRAAQAIIETGPYTGFARGHDRYDQDSSN